MTTIDTEAKVTDIQIIEPQILSADLNVTTNFEEVKQNLRRLQKNIKDWSLLIRIKRTWKKLSAKWCLSGRVFRNLKSTGNDSSAGLWINSRMPARNF